MRILQTTELKKYYGTEPDITRALDGVTLSIETLRRTFLRYFFLSVSLSFACPHRII